MAKDTNDNLGTGTFIKGVARILDDAIGTFIILVFGIAVIPAAYLIVWGAYMIVKLLSF